VGSIEWRAAIEPPLAIWLGAPPVVTPPAPRRFGGLLLRRFGETELNSTLYTENAVAGATLGKQGEIPIWPVVGREANRHV